MLSGWLWDPESNWDVELNLTDVDAEGFSYSVDFQHFTGDNTPDAPMTCGGCGTKTMMHFVRRRRLARNQCFDGKHLPGMIYVLSDHLTLTAAVGVTVLF